ncbi:sperm flagellar protein 1 [Lampris incognitus]|uniref:sperm flagellar protein 1 n=1 Tax=Lampris incognitus TaxID=2546036 RepID=UPI0024B5D107|nr:sperm flagellar protein 1 [Lampris incognitus]
MDQDLSEEKLQDLYAWIDKIPLSRPKRHVARDFSDGVMAAEVIKHFFPKLVELHNYSPASSAQQKLSNWSILNRKVFSKLNFHVTEETVKRIVLSAPGVIEPVLCILRERIDKKLERTGDNMLDSEYYNTKNDGKLPADTSQVGDQIQAQPKAGERMKKEEKLTSRNSKPQASVHFTSHVDPAVHLLLQEKEQALMTLRETVEILQMKVSRLEHLVHLKDMRIEDLTRHLDTYKTKVNMR